MLPVALRFDGVILQKGFDKTLFISTNVTERRTFGIIKDEVKSFVSDECRFIEV